MKKWQQVISSISKYFQSFFFQKEGTSFCDQMLAWESQDQMLATVFQI